METSVMNVVSDDDGLGDSVTALPMSATVGHSPEAGKPVRKKTTRRSRIPVERLKIESSVPIPPKRGERQTQSSWIPLLHSMNIGDSVVIPNTTCARLGYVHKIAKDIGINIAIRLTEDGVRLWRIPVEDETEQALPDAAKEGSDVTTQ